MPVIAMNQEMGSRGIYVAEGLVAELGLATVRHEVIEHVAEKMQMRKSTLQRFMEGKSGVLERWGIDESSLAVYKAEEILELAAKGNVLIRGYGATALLRPIAHVVCVRIGAPFDLRVKWLMERLETDDEEFVRDEIRQSDAAHLANMQSQFGVTWGDPMTYDIVLNTERVTVESCIEQIKQLVRRPEFQETPESRAQLANLALEHRVRSALRSHPKTGDVNVTVKADGGKITLNGVVLSDDEKRLAADVASQVEGVKKVDNKLKVMKKAKIFPR